MNAVSEGRRRASIYAEREQRFRASAEALTPRVQRCASVGALALLATALTLIAVLVGSAPPIALAAVPAGLVACAAAFARRARLEQEEDEASRRARVNARADARCRDAWRTLPEDGATFLDPKRPLGVDLDLFGPSSLFQFVNVAHSPQGQRELARLFTEEATLATSRERQHAVRRLAPELELRQTIETLTLPPAPVAPTRATSWLRPGAPARRPDLDALLDWIETAPRLSRRRGLVWAARVLPALTALAVAAALILDAPSLLWKLGVAAQGLLAYRARHDVADLFALVGHWQGAFARLARALHAMAELPSDDPLLERLRRTVHDGAGSARLELERLDRILGWFALRNSEWGHPPINLLTSWDLHCVIALERWQRQSGPKLRGWLDALGQVEALSSLAGAAHDHPHLTFPDWIDGAPAFLAVGLGHPLLPQPARVDNDVSLPGPGHALLVTGSNMSGKSTLLRAIGLASVLARAGGPVCARSLRLGAMSVHSSLRINDSLADSVSHFYAELQRLRDMLTATRGPLPVLFLIDEILAGTNSLERGIGARWLLAELLRAGALGAISTHDGDLCKLPPDLMQRVEHVHFRETVEDGKLAFDYRLHPGPVKAGNALRLMRSMGLAVN